MSCSEEVNPQTQISGCRGIQEGEIEDKLTDLRFLFGVTKCFEIRLGS